MDKINIIVFSKDRAMQLDLFIRSFIFFVEELENYDIDVLYTYSDDVFKQGYDKFMGYSPDFVHFHKEQSFKKDLISLVDPAKEYTVFFVDDNVFKNDFNFHDGQMEIFNQNKDIICRSLRLHTHLTFCYAQQKPMKPPLFMKDNVFTWRGQDGDYGYPMSVDGHIFRTRDILSCVTDLEYSNPNSFEGAMVNRSTKLPLMICYNESIIVNNPINIVQTNNPNAHGNVSASFLNDKFLKGEVISLTTFIGIDNISCHQEITPNFIKG